MSPAIPSARPAPAGAGAFFASTDTAGPDRPSNPAAAIGPASPARAAAPVDPRHLLGLEGLGRDAILALLDAAAAWRARLATPRFASDVLRGVAIGNVFFEDSTRTRCSFELAERRLGALPVSFAAAGSSLSKGESLLDTART